MTRDSVLFILWSGAAFGGLERRYLRLAGYLAGQPGLDVTLHCQERAYPSVTAVLRRFRLTPVAVPVARWATRLPTMVTRVYELARMVQMMRASACTRVVFCGNPGFIAGVLACFKRDDQALVVPNALLFVDLPLGILDRAGIALAAHRGVTIDHLSDEPEQVFAAIAGSRSAGFRHRTAPGSFTDYSRIQTSDERDIDIIMLARFVDGKGYDLLERIDERIRYNAHYCGFGPRRPRINNAEVYQTDEPFSLLARSKVFLSLQQGNNYPSQSLLEAMASGCAVIATDVGETRKLLDESRAVLIRYDAGELLQAIEMLMGDEALRERLAESARTHVLSHHTVERYAEYFTEQVLEQRGIA